MVVWKSDLSDRWSPELVVDWLGRILVGGQRLRRVERHDGCNRRRCRPLAARWCVGGLRLVRSSRHNALHTGRLLSVAGDLNWCVAGTTSIVLQYRRDRIGSESLGFDRGDVLGHLARTQGLLHRADVSVRQWSLLRERDGLCLQIGGTCGWLLDGRDQVSRVGEQHRLLRIGHVGL